MNKMIEELEREQMKTNLPNFAPGDTVTVKVKVPTDAVTAKSAKPVKGKSKAVEVERERFQIFEGVVIAIRKRGLNSAFTVRKIAHGEGVERVFQTHSPMISDIKVVRRGDVRRAKLYYLRDRSGKSARIREKLDRPTD